jgi:YVTN family beta-propeller protein
MPDLPSGTVTFLFTDIEGSTRLLRENRPNYGQILAEHGEILRAAFEKHGGREIDTQGDSFFAAFRTARDAVEAAAAAQQGLAGHSWPGGAEPKVRMGLHTGEPVVSGNRYVGLAVHRAARVCAAAHGCQVLLSSTTADLIADELPPNSSLGDLGQHRLKDFDRPERVYQLVVEGLPATFPPPRTLEPAELPAAADPDGRRPARWPLVGLPRLQWLILALGVLVLVPVVAVIAGTFGAPASDVSRRSIAVIDPDGNKVVDSVPLGASASSVVAFDDAIWTISPQDRTLMRIDPMTHEVTRRGVGIVPYSLEAGDEALWIAGGDHGTLVRYRPQTDELAEPEALSAPADGYPLIAAVGDSLWLGQNDSTGLARFDTRKERITVRRGRTLTPEAIAANEEGVWVIERSDAEITRLDPESGSMLGSVPFGAPKPGAGFSTIHAPTSNVLLDASGLWITDTIEGKVWRISTTQVSIQDTIRVGPGALPIASGGGSVWVANRVDGTVSRIDPRTDSVTATIKVADHVNGIAFAAGTVWVTVP